ncbi:hypothetical protein B0H12DRAFT_1230726 [Mycena haematopus]|nr:hypothetical protein B0H12DRAFT_1230726 [Mycena haematopus]
MSTNKLPSKRSFTGNHPILPAMRPEPPPFIPKVPSYAFLKWTLGRGSVIWKIWPAVLLHTLFATAIVYIYFLTERMVQIPNVMLTVMGVVIGFVISYRAMSGYDRYWMGRTAWTDVIRNARTMEMAKVMAEKYMALDLVEAFAVSLKHHIRGEVGIYYQDLYELVRPLHDFTDPENPRPTVASAVPATPAVVPTSSIPPTTASTSSASSSGVSTSSTNTLKTSIHQPLLPASNPAPYHDGVLNQVSAEIIPFAGWQPTSAPLEHILTTPLPFVVWLYLFLLPLQLVNDFGWHTVPAVRLRRCIVYLGFLAAGEEIEQPFGYDDNDLDLDMFCRDIIRQDIRSLKKAPCLNAWFPPRAMITQPTATNGKANTDGSLRSPEASTLGPGLHAYGGNMYRASLASLSDSASVISEEEEEAVAEDDADADTETEFEHDARTRRAEEAVRVGELVDTR